MAHGFRIDWDIGRGHESGGRVGGARLGLPRKHLLKRVDLRVGQIGDHRVTPTELAEYANGQPFGRRALIPQDHRCIPLADAEALLHFGLCGLFHAAGYYIS